MTAAGQKWRNLHFDGRTLARHLPPDITLRPKTGVPRMQPLRFTEQFKSLFKLALQLSESAEVEAVLLLLEGPADWQRLKNTVGERKLLVAADTLEQLAGRPRRAWPASA